MSQQLIDLQTAIAALQEEDTTLVAAVSSAVTNLVALEAQVAALGANTDTASLAALTASVTKITSDLTTAVGSLNAAEPVAPAPVAPPAAS